MDIINIFEVVLSLYLSYVILGVAWSLFEWHGLVRDAKKRFDNRTVGSTARPDQYLPDKKTTRTIVLNSMLVWPSKFLQYLAFKTTNWIFSLSYEMLFFMYRKVVTKYFGK